MKKAVLALALAGCLSLMTGCGSTMSFRGTYTSESRSGHSDRDPPVLAEDQHFSIAWGLIRVGGDFDVDEEIGLRHGEAIENLEIEERPTVLGVILWFFTGGFVDESEVVVRGNRVSAPAPTAYRPARHPY